MEYIFVLIIVYFISWNKDRIPEFSRFFLFIPFIIFSTFRGSAGKDTPAYIHRFNVFDGEIFSSIDSEPILSIIFFITKIFSDQKELFFFLHAILISFLYNKVLTEDKFKFFSYVLGPVFLIDGTTNAMRASIAYFIFLAYNSSWLKYLSFFGHASILVSWLAEYIFRYRFLILFIPIAALLIPNILVQFGPSFLSDSLPTVDYRFYVYQNIQKNSFYSGIGDSLIFGSLIYLLINNSYRNLNFKTAILTIFIIILCVVLTGVSVAFIRVVKLLIIGFIGYSLTRKPKEFFFLQVGGLLYGLNFLRQIFSDDRYFPYGDF